MDNYELSSALIQKMFDLNNTLFHDELTLPVGTPLVIPVRFSGDSITTMELRRLLIKRQCFEIRKPTYSLPNPSVLMVPPLQQSIHWVESDLWLMVHRNK